MKWFQVAQDIIAQHEATHEPIERLLGRIVRARGLGSRDRKLVGDAVFGWARLQGALPDQLEQRLMSHVRRSQLKAMKRQVLLAWAVRDQIELELLLEPTLCECVRNLSPMTNAWPAWFEEIIGTEYGDRAEALLASLKQRAKSILAVDRRHMTTSQAQQLLCECGVTTEISPLVEQALIVTSERFVWSNLPQILKKSVWLMDDGSQMIASLVKAKPGERVLDMCAGGGGKTRYLLQTGAELTAMDISSSRMKSLKDRIKGEKVKTLVADGLEPPLETGSFDWVLLDAPCSGTGTLRRSPDLLSRLSLKELEKYAELQKKLIAQAARLMKPQGKLVYATCSILACENTEVVEYAKQELGLRSTTELQLLPSEHGCDGFFMAVLERVEP